MLHRISISYLVACVITVIVILIEVGFRSAAVSPMILLNSNDEASSSKILIGESLFHGDYLMSHNEDLKGNSDNKVQLTLVNKVITFHEITPENSTYNIGFDKGLESSEVILRRGFKITNSEKIPLKKRSSNLFFEKYTLDLSNSSNIILKTSFKYSIFIVVISTILTIFIPGLLFFVFNIKESFKNIFTLFLPFVLAVFFPLIINYYLLMGYLLSITNSYAISVVTAILIPILLSILFTTYSFEIITKKADPQVPDEESRNMKDLFMLSNKEQIGIFFMITTILIYFSSYLVFPLYLQAEIMNNLYMFTGWYLFLLFLFLAGYSILQKIFNSYENLNSNEINCIRESLENLTSKKINIMLKKDSKHEINAWIYSFKIPFQKRENLFITEGLLERFDAEEIKAILLHEMGHIKLKHSQFTVVSSIIITIVMSVIMYFARQYMLLNGWWQYIFILPFGILCLIFITEWLPKKISRAFEIQADNFAASHLNDKYLYVNTLKKLKAFVYEEEEYPNNDEKNEWRKNHPSFEKRINNLNENDK